MRALRAELADHRAYLLPLRIFIGLGWLRAAAEKIIEPGWYDGSALTAFLRGQLEWSQEELLAGSRSWPASTPTPGCGRGC